MSRMEEPFVTSLPPKHFAILVGLSLSLSVAFLDLVVATNTQLIVISSGVVFFGPLVAMFAAVLTAYAAGLLVLAAPLRRFTSLRLHGLTVGVAAFVAVPFVIRIIGWEASTQSGTRQPAVLAELALSCLGFLVVYLAWEGIGKFPRSFDFVLYAALSIPILLSGTFGFQWLVRETVGRSRSWEFFLLLLLYLVVCGAAIRYLTRPKHPQRTRAALSGLAAAVSLGLAISFAVESVPPPSLPPAPNGHHTVRRIILLTVDTLRRDALSCYGGRTQTPYIDRLAKDGILFENAYAPAPWTLPSLATILSGVSPWVHGATRLGHAVPTGLPSLAAFLKRDGYLTASIGSNYVLALRGSQPSFSRGFDVYDFYPKRHRPLTKGRQIAVRFLPTAFGDIASTDHLTRLAQRWVSSYRDRDFFLWLHYYDPHIPYDPPAAFSPPGEPDPAIGKRFLDKRMNEIQEGAFRPSRRAMDWVRALYHSEVRYVDDRIGRFIATLKDLGLYDDTLIVFTSDHGEEHYEHRGIDHGHSLYEELLRVPLIVKLPGSTVKAEIEQTVSLESVLPTILDLCNIEFDRGAFSGRSLQSLWTDAPSSNSEAPVFSTGLMIYEEREAVVFDGLKYIRSLDWPREELYDLEMDPGEKNNIAFLRADKVAQARELLAAKTAKSAKLRKLYGLGPVRDIPLDAATIERLRSLGYAQ